MNDLPRPYIFDAITQAGRALRFRWRDRRRRHHVRLRDIFAGGDESDLTFPRLDDDPRLRLRGREWGGRWPL